MIFRAMVLAMLPVAALAEAAPDCGDAVTQAEMSLCAAQRLERADTDLNEAWTAAMGRMHRIDDGLAVGDRGAADALRSAQRAWLTLRDQGCEAAAWSYAGGSARPLVLTGCKADATEARAAELRDLAKRPDE